MQKPSLGRIVIAMVRPADNNGETTAPAMITRVWSDRMVNLRVLHDGPAVSHLASVTLYETPEDLAAAKAERDERTPGMAHVPLHAAHWPARV